MKSRPMYGDLLTEHYDRRAWNEVPDCVLTNGVLCAYTCSFHSNATIGFSSVRESCWMALLKPGDANLANSSNQSGVNSLNQLSGTFSR
jgi:hypothetical protein